MFASPATSSASTTLASPLRLLATGQGGVLCRIDSTGRQVVLSFSYDPPKAALPSSNPLRLPVDLFSLNRKSCNRARGAEFEFVDDRYISKLKFADPLSPFALAVQQANALGENMSMFVASAVTTSAGTNATDTPQCMYSESTGVPAFVSNFLIGTPRVDVQIPTPDPREKLILRANIVYGLFNIDVKVPEGAGTLCIFVDERAAESIDGAEGETRASYGSRGDGGNSDQGAGKGLSPGGIIGIVVGSIGIVLAIAIIFTAAHCWRKQSDEISDASGSESARSNSSEGHLSVHEIA